MSGAADYQSLCLAAKTEEKRLAEIKKRRQYHSEHKYKNTSSSKPDSSNSRAKDPHTLLELPTDRSCSS